MNRPYSSVEHLARSLWLSDFRWTNRMAMYSAYFDESGHPDSGKYLVVAGAVADVDQWVHLDREWKGVLEPLGIEVFHATDFEERKRPFDSLSDPRREELLMSLVRIICRRVEKTLSSAVELSQHAAVNGKYVFSECYAFPYPQVARACIGYVEEWATKHQVPRAEIGYFFEDGAKHKGQIQWIAERDGIPVPDFREKKRTPLQVGDLLAWSHNLFLSSGGKIPSLYRKALDVLDRSSTEWGLIDMSDPDRIPTILGIPLRDPNMNYKCRVIKQYGKRTASVHYWPKRQRIEPKVERKTLVLPDVKRLSPDDVKRLAAEYDAKLRGAVQ